MIFKRKLLILICRLIIIVKYSDANNAKVLPQRIQQLMINYLDRGVFKINEVTEIRAKYEISPHFELGYLVSEILERYRKMVVLVLRPIQYHSDVVFETISHTEIIQKLFLEVCHLVNMVHEITRKYKDAKGFSQGTQFNRQILEEYNQKLQENLRQRERERKKRLKELKKQRELFKKGEMYMTTRGPRKPSNKWWPIDYGWEIDYHW